MGAYCMGVLHMTPVQPPLYCQIRHTQKMMDSFGKGSKQGFVFLHGDLPLYLCQEMADLKYRFEKLSVYLRFATLRPRFRMVVVRPEAAKDQALPKFKAPKWPGKQNPS